MKPKTTVEPGEESPVVLRFKHVLHRLAISRSAIYARMAADDFPQALQLGPRAIGWLKADIDAWLESRTRCDRKQTVKP